MGNLPLQPLNHNTLNHNTLNHNTLPIKTVNNNILSKLGNKKDCLHMNNIPLEANMANILAFLDDMARKATSVHIMYDMHGMPRGEAIIQMDGPESAKSAAAQTSGKQIIFNGKTYVLESAQISKEEMFSKTIAQAPANNPLAGPNNPLGNGLLQTPQQQHQAHQALHHQQPALTGQGQVSLHVDILKQTC